MCETIITKQKANDRINMKIFKNFLKDGLKKDISQINGQLHKTNKNKIKKIYSELEKFTAEELNDFFDFELFNFVESTQELPESNKNCHSFVFKSGCQ